MASNDDNLVALLKWQLETKDLAEMAKTAEQAEAVGDHNHPSLQIFREAPKLTGYELAFWEAYGELCSERGSPGMAGMQPIPFRAILAYATFWEYTRSETEALLKAIRAMDNAHIAHSNDQAQNG